MPADKEFLRRHPLFHCFFLLLWGSVVLCWSLGVLRNGGIGKWGAPTVTPDNNPFGFWAAVVISGGLGIGAIVYAVRKYLRLAKIAREELEK